MIAYLDLPSGLAGDMMLGCLVDAGWPLARLQATIASLGLPAEMWSIRQETVMRGPLRATLVHVETVEGHVHRHLHDIRALITAAELPEAVREQAIAIFTRLAAAEASVHGTSVEEVHFHEVGALDAIIDIVGVCAGLHELGITQLYASSVPLGEGWTQSAHGRIPVPAPATLELLSAVGAPLRPAPGPGELVTPTGAAILAELATFRQPRFNLQRIGLGTGQKNFEWPNIARLLIGDAAESGEFVVLETNIDDMNPELYGAVSEQLFAAGARDVWLMPIQMKKGRPGVLLSVLAPAAFEQVLADLILRETTTLGVRARPVHRHEAQRTFTNVQTAYGEVRVKIKWLEQRMIGVKPEYEDCLRLAQEHGVPVRQVLATAQVAAEQLLAVHQEHTNENA
jgi:uncharacterized protein (TIGR00299 family) protein